MQRERDAHLMFLVIWVILQSDVLLGRARHVRRDGVPHRSEERRSAHFPTNPFSTRQTGKNCDATLSLGVDNTVQYVRSRAGPPCQKRRRDVYQSQKGGKD